MTKIKMITPIVEIDGDEMTRILWSKIKEILIEPYVELKTEYYDLGLDNREKTKDQITIDAANAIKRLGVGVKCATITPNAQRLVEYNLTQMWKSPNGTIRAILDGTVFREPILIDGITPLVKNWVKPIIIARHAHGDVYSAVELRTSNNERISLQSDLNSSLLVKDFKSPGIVQAMFNTDESISSFAHSCFKYALDQKLDIWFSTKDTISKIYDHRFKDIFSEIYEKFYKKDFEANNIEYFYTLIDDAVARVMRSDGGFIWACKNYDGDVMSDMLATVFGSLAMMTSVLVSPNGQFEYEAAHGTVTRHFYKYKNGEYTSTNSVATIFAWTGALAKRGELDNLPLLINYAEKLEKATKLTIERGIMTGDLVSLFDKRGVATKKVESIEFLEAINKTFKEL